MLHCLSGRRHETVKSGNAFLNEGELPQEGVVLSVCEFALEGKQRRHNRLLELVVVLPHVLDHRPLVLELSLLVRLQQLNSLK